jgi:uncharacterized protein YcbX
VNDTTDTAVTLSGLYVYPVKSCAGIAVDEALLIETGLEFDRAWMLVDDTGRFLSQRTVPRMALIRPTLRYQDMVLRAPGMLALHVLLDTVEEPVRVHVHNDEVKAYDMGALAAQWFSDFLGRPVRLVRFDPDQKRLSSKRWTGDIDAENQFADAFPLLVTSTASMAELNRRLALQEVPAMGPERFRPNLVIDGLDAHGEDVLDELRFDTDEGPVVLKLVKPCTRCTIPNVDPATGEQGHQPGDTLAGYRADPRMDGAITFGMDAVIVEGIERPLRTGLAGRAVVRF